MKRVVFVVGHSFYDNGAENKKTGDTEYKFNLEVAHWIMKNERFKNIDTVIKARNAAYEELPEEIDTLNPNLIVCLHANAHNEKVQGTEMWYWNTSSKGSRAAKIIQTHMVSTLGLHNRGVKPAYQGDNGWPVLKRTHAPCIIGEPFFIDALDIIDNTIVEKVGKAYLDAVEEIFTKDVI